MKKQQYIRPELTVVAFRTERGYAASAIDEVADRVNRQLGEWASQTQQDTIIGSVTDQGLWRDGQGVAGIGNGDDGLQAGYFGTGSTEGWF